MDNSGLDTILKIGGSILTDKSGFESLNKESLERTIGELKDFKNFILIHGVGSFGHAHVKKYRVVETQSRDKILETHIACRKLNWFVMEEMRKNNLYALPIHPFTSVITRDGKIHIFDMTLLIVALQRGFIPVLHGDMVYDMSNQYIPLSGDEIARFLGKQLMISRIGMATSVDGIFDDSGNFIERITPKNYDDVIKYVRGSDNDVTGGMRNKLSSLFHLTRYGVEINIFNGLKKGNIKRFMTGENVGTVITGERD
jgi:isopentenyl phosphate kinase